MADTKITSLGGLTTPADNDKLVIVDISDTSMGASGTTKNITRANFLGSELDDIEERWIPASALTAAGFDLYEDTDNGSNKITVKAPSSITSDRSITFPDADGELLTDQSTISDWNATSVTPTYSSSTSGVDTISFASTDLTGTLQEGAWARISSTAGSNLIYKIKSVSYSTNTTVTVVGETSVSGTITSFEYSNAHSPIGVTPWNELFKFSAAISGTATATASAFTKLPLNVESYDNNGDFDNATNYRYTAPVTGTYNFCAQGELSPAGTTNLFTLIDIFVNGSSSYRGGRINGATSDNLGVTVSKDIYLNRGDYAELYLYNSSGTNKTIGYASPTGKIGYMTGKFISIF